MKTENMTRRAFTAMIASALAILLVLNTTLAADSTNYDLGDYHTGTAANDGDSTNYDSTFNIDYNQPANQDTESTSYTAKAGWYPEVMVYEYAILHSVECSIDGTSFMPCANLQYNNTIKKIRANCTAVTTTINSVTFNLYNTEDNNAYINNAGYTSTENNFYTLSPDYLVQDSGNWNLTITCSDSEVTKTNSDTFSLPWGQLTTTQITPTTNTSKKQHDFFTYTTRVTCVGGECGTVEATLDPKVPTGVEIINHDTIWKKIWRFIENLGGNMITGATVTETICEEISTCTSEPAEQCTNTTVDICEEICTPDCTNYTNATQQCTESCTTTETQNCTTTYIETCTIEEVCEDITINKTTPTTPEKKTIDIESDKGNKATITLNEDLLITKSTLTTPKQPKQKLSALEVFEFNTEILAAEIEDYTGATIYLPKLTPNEIKLISKCDIWNFNDNECLSGWYEHETDPEQNTTHVWFDTESFSAYAGGNLSAGQTSFLTIWDQTDLDMPNAGQSRNLNQDITFYADFTATANGTDIEDAACEITFNSINFSSMTYDPRMSEAYTYTRQFTTSGSYTFTIRCNHSTYTDLQATDTIAVPTGTKTGAVSTTTGDTPFYTTDSNPQTCDIRRSGQSCTSTWSVNATGRLESAHTFFTLYNLTSNRNYVNDTQTENIQITIVSEDNEAPIILSTTTDPTIISNNTAVNLYAPASDNFQVEDCWAVITKPDTTTTLIADTCEAQKQYTATQIGTHNITFYANDTEGNTGNSSDYFKVQEPVVFTIDTNTSNGSANVVIIIIFPETNETVDQDNSSGGYSSTLPGDIFNIKFEGHNDTVIITLEGVNITSETGKTFGIDKLADNATDDLATYGINNEFNFTSATLVLAYPEANAANETFLRLLKCNDWNFTSQTCEGTWTDITDQATLDTTTNTFTFTTSSFSGFAIQQGPYCGDNSCNGVETCSDCQADCGSCSSGAGTGGTTGQDQICLPRWECTNWTECRSYNQKLRTCTDKNDCGLPVNKPDESMYCNYIPPGVLKEPEPTQKEEPAPAPEPRLPPPPAEEPEETETQVKPTMEQPQAIGQQEAVAEVKKSFTEKTITIIKDNWKGILLKLAVAVLILVIVIWYKRFRKRKKARAEKQEAEKILPEQPAVETPEEEKPATEALIKKTKKAKPKTKRPAKKKAAKKR
ncbi:hypothetical protein ACFL3V_06085 [Nanoarchaeota archaeon]